MAHPSGITRSKSNRTSLGLDEAILETLLQAQKFRRTEEWNWSFLGHAYHRSLSAVYWTFKEGHLKKVIPKIVEVEDDPSGY